MEKREQPERKRGHVETRRYELDATFDVGRHIAEFLRDLLRTIWLIFHKPHAPRVPSGFSRVTWKRSGHIAQGNIEMAQGRPNEVGIFEAAFANASGRVIEVANAEWSSSDEGVATVTPDVGDGTTTPKGIVTLHGEGDAIIKCLDPDPDDDPGTEGVVEVVGMAICRDNTVAVGTMTEGTFGPAETPTP